RSGFWGRSSKSTGLFRIPANPHVRPRHSRAQVLGTLGRRLEVERLAAEIDLELAGFIGEESVRIPDRGAMRDAEARAPGFKTEMFGRHNLDAHAERRPDVP